jgi:hypothetical protein
MSDAAVDGIILGGLVAGLGYVGKLVLSEIDSIRQRRRSRIVRLIEIQSLLLASQAVFREQCKVRNELVASLEMVATTTRGYDAILAESFGGMSEQQRLIHSLVRSYTVDGLHPLNRSMLSWLAEDRDFLARSDELGRALRQLQAHLVLWLAKYATWIPGRPERALVFLGDRLDKSAAFPGGIEALILRETGTPTGEYAAQAKSKGPASKAEF